MSEQLTEPEPEPEPDPEPEPEPDPEPEPPPPQSTAHVAVVSPLFDSQMPLPHIAAVLWPQSCGQLLTSLESHTPSPHLTVDGWFPPLFVELSAQP